MHQRTSILWDTTARLSGFYGPAGTEIKLFRKVQRGPMRPMSPVLPALTVMDTGQRRGEAHDEESEERILGIRLALQLADEWEKVGKVEEWSDNVELLIHKMVNWCPTSRGVRTMRYEQDDWIDWTFASGASEATWFIDFECQYFVEVELKADWP